MTRLRRAALVLLASSAACDGALVDGTYRGEPLLTVQGELKVIDKTASGAPAKPLPAGQLRLAVLWLGAVGAATGELFSADVEQSLTPVAVFPARYRVALYAPPPAAAVLRDSAEGAYALGVLAAYVDANGNGAFDRDIDGLVGGATAQRVVVYAPQGLQATWLTQPIGAGYHRMVAQGAGTACKKSGRVTLAIDAQADTEVKVFTEVPATLFPDVDCDGANADFAAACPSPAKAAAECAKGNGNPYICDNCPW